MELPPQFIGTETIHIVQDYRSPADYIPGSGGDWVPAPVQIGDGIRIIRGDYQGKDALVSFSGVNNAGALGILTAVEILLRERRVTRSRIMELLPALAESRMPQTENDIRGALRLDEFVKDYGHPDAEGVYLDFAGVTYTRDAVDAALRDASDEVVREVLRYDREISVHNGQTGHGSSGCAINIWSALLSWRKEDGLSYERFDKILLGFPIHRTENVVIDEKKFELKFRRDGDSPRLFLEAVDDTNNFRYVITGKDDTSMMECMIKYITVELQHSSKTDCWKPFDPAFEMSI